MKKLIFILLLFPIFCFAQLEDSITPKTANYNEVITKTVKGNLQTYIAKSGERFTVGDTITLGTPFRNETFNFIQQYAIGQVYSLNSLASGSQVVIKTIKAYAKLPQLFTTHAKSTTYGLFVRDLELALANGEIKSKIMSSDEALQELKKCKDKLDLGLITQEQFDAKKAELSKLIK